MELTEEVEKELQEYIKEIEQLLAQDEPPECIHKSTCKNVRIMNIVIYESLMLSKL